MTGVEKIVTSGTFSLDGGTWDVDNNVWLVGDDSELIVIDRESFSKVMEKYPDRRSAVTEKIIQLRVARMEQQTHNMLDLFVASGLENRAEGKSSIL